MVEILCVVLENHKEAIRVGLESNKDHGLPLNDGDKAVCIKIAVAEFPELSNRKIADLVSCNSRYVDRIVNENQLRTGTQMKIGKSGKPEPVNRNPAQNKPQSQKTIVPSNTITCIVGELKVALKMRKADEEQRITALVNVVKAIYNEGFEVDAHRLDFKDLLERELPTWGL